MDNKIMILVTHVKNAKKMFGKNKVELDFKNNLL